MSDCHNTSVDRRRRRQRMSTTAAALVIVAAGFLILSGCGDSDAEPPHSAAIATPDAQPTSAASPIEEGRRAYAMYCVGCHGRSGDGQGPAARFLRPRPRDFQSGVFKFSSTRAGQLPTDEDLARSITQGLDGTGMPGWKLLPPRTVSALIAYIKTFSTKWDVPGSAIAIPSDDDPYQAAGKESEAVARGKIVYHGFATCWTCHPAYVSAATINRNLTAMENAPRDTFRDRLNRSVATTNAEGDTIYAPDFFRDCVRAGADVTSLYRAIAGGIGGTSMPTWIDSMDVASDNGSAPLVTPGDIWAMAYYVNSLIRQRPSKITPDLIDQYAPRDRRQRILATDEVLTPNRTAPDITTGELFQEEPEDSGPHVPDGENTGGTPENAP